MVFRVRPIRASSDELTKEPEHEAGHASEQESKQEPAEDASGIRMEGSFRWLDDGDQRGVTDLDDPGTLEGLL
jgi:hypothetical protein